MMKNIRILILFCIAVFAMPLAALTSCATTADIAHPYRGTNVAGGDLVWGQANFQSPVANTDYLFVSNQDIDYLVSKKVGFIRLLISWEALQPTLNGPLAVNSYSQDLDSRIAYATSKGLNVLIEPHGGDGTNFARYKGELIGSTAVPNSSFADFWTKMASKYKSNPKVLYGLSNEPHDMSTVQWFSAAQAAITGIRSTGSMQMIFVPGNGWSGSSTWTNPNVDTATVKVANSTAFLTLKDPANNLVASIHMYLDSNGGGGTTGIVSATIGVERLTAAVNWAKANSVRLHLSEIAGSQANPLASTAIKNLFDYIQANNTTVIGWSWWAYGPPSWWGGYMFTLCPTSNYTVDNAKMAWLAPYLVQLSTVGPPTPVPATDSGTIADSSVPPSVVDAATGSSTKPTAPIAFTKNAIFTTNSGQTNWVYVPNSYDNTHNTPTKLFVWLHGCGGQSRYDISMVSYMPNQDWISLAPGGRETTCWSGGLSVDGPKILASIADLKTHFNIDPTRIVLGGYSSGGDVGYPLIFSNSNMFAGGLFENTSPKSYGGMTLAATATNKFHLAHLAHTSDNTDNGNYSPATVRSNYVTLAGYGFKTEPVIEKPGTHWDSDTATSGTAYDLRTFLLPFLNVGWTNGTAMVDAGTVDAAPPPPAACTYTYSAWGACQSSGTQTRTVTGSSPVPCTAMAQTLSQSCTYVPPVVDAGTTLLTFYARRVVYNQGTTYTCMYFYVKNTSATSTNWTLMYVNSYDSKLTSWWSMKTGQVVGSYGSIKFAPVDVISIPAKTELKVGGACFDFGPLKRVPIVSGVK
jgi:endoglucanase